MTSAILVVLVIFILIISQSYLRLIQINATVNAFKNDAIPAVTNSSLLYSQINKLTYLTERMVDSKSEPALRQSISDLESHIEEITRVAFNIDDGRYMREQLNFIIDEILDLQLLVRQTLLINDKFEYKQKELFDAYRRIVEKSKGLEIGQSKYLYWQQELADVLIPIGELNQASYLQDIRKLARHFEKHLAHLENFWDDKDNAQITYIKDNTGIIKRDILGKDGLVPLKVEITRLKGRLKGRANFMHNLIEDFSNQAEYSGYTKKIEVINQAKIQQEEIINQIRYTGVMGSFAIIILIVIIWLLHSKVVKRLIELKNTIKLKQHGEDVTVVTKGNDEIADIAYSFNVYFKTVNQQKLILEELSLSDSLTDIPNRRAFDIRIRNEWDTAKREKWPITVIMIDIDCFKLYNDNYGHGKGDDCLKRVAQALENSLPRGTDFIARYGGEEFSCILQNTTKEGAEVVGARLVDCVYKEDIPHEFSLVCDRVTISVGISHVDFSEEELSNEQLQIRADKALYKAKKLGRNRFVVYNHKTMS